MSVDSQDAAIIKGMILRGDRHSDIAAWFGVNQGRIAEINTGQRHPHITAAPTHSLPPPGPYIISARLAIKSRETLQTLRDLIDQTLAEIEKWENKNHDRSHPH